MMRASRMTEEEIERGCALREQGASFGEIARVLGRHRETWRLYTRHIKVSEDREHEYSLARAVEAVEGGLHINLAAARYCIMPSDVRAEVQRRCLLQTPASAPEPFQAKGTYRMIGRVVIGPERAPRDVTAIICGDPPPGRSALDQRRAVA